MADTRYLTRPQGRVAYEVTGTGPLVVCVPGMGDTRAEYRFLAPRLAAAGRTVVAMDLRGHGDSDAGFGTYTRPDAGGDLVALLDELAGLGHDGPAHLVGTSFGAAAAVWAAAHRSERVGAVTLISPFVRDLPVPLMQRLALPVLFARPWGVRSWLWWYTRAHAGNRPDDFDAHLEVLRTSLRDPARLRALRAMASASSAAIDPLLGRITAPTLVVMGAADPDFDDPAAEGRAVAERTGGALHLVDGAGHYPQVDRPDEVARQLLAHASTHRTG